MKVLVIPEDPTLNGYILKPLVQRMLESLGRPNASVTVMTNPRMRGYANVKAAIPEIASRYRHFDLLLFLPDQDCADRTDELRSQEAAAHERGATLITCAAIEEVETWLLAGHVDKLPASWQTVRRDCSVKENYFATFLTKHGDNGPGGGRERLMRHTLHQFSGLLSRCPELGSLQDRIRECMEHAAAGS